MHLAKELEFRAVAVMACDDDVIPLASRIAELGDDADLESIVSAPRTPSSLTPFARRLWGDAHTP